MNEAQQKILTALAWATSTAPMTLNQILEKINLHGDYIDIGDAINKLLDDCIINKCFVQNQTFKGDVFWPTAKSFQPAKWSSFKINDKVPTPTRQTAPQPTKQPNKEATMTPAKSRSDAIRATITNNPGITHDELINQTTVSQHAADLKKTADLIEYVLRQGGFERVNNFSTGEVVRVYYTSEYRKTMLESAKQVVQSTVPTLHQYHEATPAQPIACEPIITVADHIGSDTKMVSALQTQEGGNHYKDMKIQPVEFIMANNLGFIEGNVVKYVSRWKNKNGVQDLKKARHFLDILIEQLEVV